MAELLGDRALQGLSEEEQLELSALLGAEDDSFDRAAAAADLSTLGTLEPLPPHLVASIEAAALRLLPAAKAPSVSRIAPRAGRDPFRFAGWVAAAACVLFAVGAWLGKSTFWSPPAAQVLAPSASPPEVAAAAAPAAAPVARPAPSALRAQVLSAADAVRVDWSPSKDPAARGASGDVVWSGSQQRGFMRFHGLATNDPSNSQYQLWIFDPSQDSKTPIDGGVFDIDPATGDVLVPITPKLHVTRPTLFAVTVEKPGGVVVSKRKRIVVTAAVGS